MQAVSRQGQGEGEMQVTDNKLEQATKLAWKLYGKALKELEAK